MLRNFEKLPEVGRDLDIILDDEIHKVEKIIKESVKKFSWTHLILDETKSNNYLKKNKIKMFYLINFRTLDFLQIDLFQSISILNTPYYIIKNNNLDLFKNKYYTIQKKISYTYHIFQINTLLNNRFKNYRKILKYRKNFLKLNFKSIYRKNILFEESLLLKISNLIKQKKFIKLRKYVNIYKFLICLNFVLKNPLKFYYLPYRCFELMLLYIFQPSGFKLDIANKKKEKKSLTRVFNLLKKKNIISDWDFADNKNFLEKIYFLKQRNILINKIEKKNSINQINYNHFFFKKLVEKNKLVFGRKFR